MANDTEDVVKAEEVISSSGSGAAGLRPVIKFEHTHCAFCHISRLDPSYSWGFIFCSRCRIVVYCSKEHQIQDTKRHRDFCHQNIWDKQNPWGASAAEACEVPNCTCKKWYHADPLELFQSGNIGLTLTALVGGDTGSPAPSEPQSPKKAVTVGTDKEGSVEKEDESQEDEEEEEDDDDEDTDEINNRVNDRSPQPASSTLKALAKGKDMSVFTNRNNVAEPNLESPSHGNTGSVTYAPSGDSYTSTSTHTPCYCNSASDGVSDSVSEDEEASRSSLRTSSINKESDSQSPRDHSDLNTTKPSNVLPLAAFLPPQLKTAKLDTHSEQSDLYSLSQSREQWQESLTRPSTSSQSDVHTNVGSDPLLSSIMGATNAYYHEYNPTDSTGTITTATVTSSDSVNLTAEIPNNVNFSSSLLGGESSSFSSLAYTPPLGFPKPPVILATSSSVSSPAKRGPTFEQSDLISISEISNSSRRCSSLLGDEPGDGEGDKADDNGLNFANFGDTSSMIPFHHRNNMRIGQSAHITKLWIQQLWQQVIDDMNRYGVCVVDNLLGEARGNAILQEVQNLYGAGCFKDGQLVKGQRKNIRGDKITWVDGREPHCRNISVLIKLLDNIVMGANNRMNNGKLGTYKIKERSKAMVACYPGSGTQYVKHVDNPNDDGRIVTAIYYLNKDWTTRENGGLLRIFPEGWSNQVADIEPLFDRVIFFWSDRRNPHEVQPAYKTRYAITLWYFDALAKARAERNKILNASSTPVTSVAPAPAASSSSSQEDVNKAVSSSSSTSSLSSFS